MNFLRQLFGGQKAVDVKNYIEQGAFLVDVRTPGEFAAGHVKGSVNIPLSTISSNLSRFRGRKYIIVFCLSGGRSSQAKSILEKAGFTQVINGGSWNQVNKLIS